MASTTAHDKDKRKNSEPTSRRPQWLLLIIGIVIGATLMLIVMQGRGATTVTLQSDIPEGIEMTATAIINGATATAQAVGAGS